MDTSTRCLINSICRFIHLVSCQSRKPMAVQKYYMSMVLVLKHLKPLLDEVADHNESSEEVIWKECENFDATVNEAREFLENWCPRMSKISSVRQSEALFMKMKSSSLELCHILARSLRPSTSTSSLTAVQQCMEEISCIQQEKVTEHIEEAVRSQRDDIIPCTDHLRTIIESLSLTSNQELLRESIAVEKERTKIQVNKGKRDLDQIDQIVDLVAHIRNCLLKEEHFEPRTGVVIPSYFRCPLSLELMLDPVIVASGQTFDRAAIQTWLDNGLTICPKTRQTLSHTNLISNYTVKAMIANWCDENKIRIPSKSQCNSFSNPSDCDFIASDSFHGSFHSSNLTSRSSLEVRNGFEKQKSNVSSKLSEGESNGFEIREAGDLDRPSHELSYTHSRSESTSSATSSIEYLPPASNEVLEISTKLEYLNGLPEDIASACPAVPPLNKEAKVSPWLSGKQMTEANVVRSLPSGDSGSDDKTANSHVQKLIEDLKSQSNDVHTRAAAELRLLAKHKMENRAIIGHGGAIKPLVSLLYSEVKLTQEHAVTALLNLSINEEIKAMIAEAGAIEPLIHVLKSGNDGAKENSAATLFSLSVLEEYKVKIGRSGAVKALVDLLGSGTLRGKKDAATALFNLSIFHENRARIVQAGAVKHLVQLLEPVSQMVDKAVALLANLSTIGEGCLAIARAGGIPLLVEVVESGSQRGKENAASILLQMCLNSPKFCTLVLQEGAVPPLVALSQSGSPRAKEKAQQLLSHFRNQREGSRGKRKP